MTVRGDAGVWARAMLARVSAQSSPTHRWYRFSPINIIMDTEAQREDVEALGMRLRAASGSSCDLSCTQNGSWLGRAPFRESFP